ncbi:unnamed protein product [Cyprideis torosa]|uniref:Uncharacterized protein n=1 Tax=Cyprideis torosa TaxID=163714 RepID=A0A7R8ZT16_9CRUS|nr:unnamed protein product [Cyprideis torosa]CAG0897118.1 unnamed protein product [Cyprideis torosa]
MGCLGSRADGRLWLILLLGLCAEHVFSSPNSQRSRETAGNVGYPWTVARSQLYLDAGVPDEVSLRVLIA